MGVERKFVEFEKHYGKNYDLTERQHRLQVFADNLRTIETLRHAERGTATFSHLTPYADLSAAEFSGRLGLVESDVKLQVDDSLEDNLADSFDWRENGFTTHVKNQLSCGSCWTFSIAANVEGSAFKETGKLVRLSEQELLDCSSKDTGSGPNQGFTDKTMQWMIDNGIGLEYEEDYPYKAVAGTCKHIKANEVVRISNVVLMPQDEVKIATALVQYGVLSIQANANDWHMYQQGIYDHEACINAGLNHGVALVGFGADVSTPYWTIRNSWGIGWGEKGHIRMVRGKGMCGLQKRVASATGVTVDDSRPEPPFIIGPNCCESKNIFVEADCHNFCKNHTGWNSWSEPGPYCGCNDGDGCKPFPECNDDEHMVV